MPNESSKPPIQVELELGEVEAPDKAADLIRRMLRAVALEAELDAREAGKRDAA